MDPKAHEHDSDSLGFARRGEPDAAPGAVVAAIPDSLAGAQQSVCGVKGFMIDELRRFRSRSGAPVVVRCAAVAALDILDSPVHVHSRTLETYSILSGAGRMVLGERVERVRQGSVVLIPPGVEHGLVSDHPQTPLRVLMTFSPGLAPVSAVEFRDERITHELASVRAAQLQQEG